jgi:hypothetical protein
MRISEAGALEGVPRVRAAHRFELWPYTTGAWIAAPQSPGAERLANDLSAKFGFNAKIKITENLTGDVTVNTDFAQTEVDKAVVNLTRFPVQLPEKREFFLENAGFFGFASPDQTSVFFSRRIGLSANGEPLPIDFGGRVTGKIGRWDVGVLNVESRASGETPAMNSTVLRAKLGVLQKSYVGAILTNAHSAQDGNRNQAYGVDSQLSFSNVFGQNVSFTASLAGTSTAGARRDRHAAYAGVLYPNDQLEAFFNYSFIDRGFNPELGFLKRSGFDRFSAKWRFQPRPPAPFDKWIRKIDVKPLEINVYRSLPGRELESLSQEFRPIGADFQSGDSFEFNVIRHFDRLDEPFDVLDDVIIAPGRYWWTSYELQLDTAEKRRWQLSAACSWGEYYSGRMKELSLDGNISLTQRLKVSAEYATNRADVGGSGFTTHEIAARVLYAFTNRANVQVFTQWNNESHHADVYVRLQISPKVGSDIYGVFNQLLDTRKGRRANIGRAARVKAVYPLYF